MVMKRKVEGNDEKKGKWFAERKKEGGGEQEIGGEIKCRKEEGEYFFPTLELGATCHGKNRLACVSKKD